MAEIYTTKGMLEEDTLHKSEGFVDNEKEYTTWTEFYLGNELVRRDVHVTLKEGMVAFPSTGLFN